MRYFTTWLEEIELDSSSAVSSDSETETETETSDTSVPTDQELSGGLFSIDLDDLGSGNKASSFPSIIFENSRSGSKGDGSGSGEEEDSSDDEGQNLLQAPGNTVRKGSTTPPPPQKQSLRTLYIQMVRSL